MLEKLLRLEALSKVYPNTESATPPQADEVSAKDFHLKAVASVTLDPVFTYDGFAGETLYGVSKLALREGE